MENTKRHPLDPPSNVPTFAGYNPDNYTLSVVPIGCIVDESLTPGCPPRLTQRTIGKYLQPLTRELTAVPPRPTVNELSDAVKDQMVLQDKAFWVDKPGANAYVLHDAYYNYGLTTEIVKPSPQAVFPRSYQYDLDCVKYRRFHGCDGLKSKDGKTAFSYCRDCSKPASEVPQSREPVQIRWRDYPDVKATLTAEEVRVRMDEVGRPFQNEACNWYYKNYPSEKFPVIQRRFSK